MLFLYRVPGEGAEARSGACLSQLTQLVSGGRGLSPRPRAPLALPWQVSPFSSQVQGLHETAGKGLSA